MVDWSHGYDVSVGYTFGFYREMAPDWLDLCTRLNGFAAPRRGPSGQFRYLELGMGQGLGLCLLAAAYPQGEFLGIDFHPEHVAHAQTLADSAGLTNIRFVEADFIDLAEQWPADYGTFDYVTMHGIVSWIAAPIRKAVVQCVSHATRPGAVVYSSFNTQPGWLGSMPFQHVALRLKDVTGRPGKAVLEEAVGLFEKLAENNAALFKVMPSVKARVDMVKKQNSSYAIQEYLNEGWTPLWHSQVARDFARVKLGYVGSATIAESQLPGMLPASMREIIAAQPDGTLRQDIQDIAINQTFRRDIYSRGARRITNRDLLDATRLYLLTEPGQGPIEVKTAFGQNKIEPSGYAEIVDAVRTGPKSIEELAALPGARQKGRDALLRILALMIDARTLAVACTDTVDETVSHRLNAVIAREGSRGARYRYLASPKLASAILVEDVDLRLIDSWLESAGKADAAALSRALADRLARAGSVIKEQGKALKGADVDRWVNKAVATFFDVKLPNWQRLGVLP